MKGKIHHFIENFERNHIFLVASSQISELGSKSMAYTLFFTFFSLLNDLLITSQDSMETEMGFRISQTILPSFDYVIL